MAWPRRQEGGEFLAALAREVANLDPESRPAFMEVAQQYLDFQYRKIRLISASFTFVGVLISYVSFFLATKGDPYQSAVVAVAVAVVMGTVTAYLMGHTPHKANPLASISPQ
ncbi:hypothetical protein ACWGE1_22505 [Streptomyces sp. NPDC054932]